MAVFEWVRFLAGGFLLLFGLGIFAIEIIGVYRFRYVLNRMHAAAMGDTLGIGFSLMGLIIMSGLNFTSLKLLFVIVFLWFSSPASSHLIARLEVTTDEDQEEHYRVAELKELEASLRDGGRDGAAAAGTGAADAEPAKMKQAKAGTGGAKQAKKAADTAKQPGAETGGAKQTGKSGGKKPGSPRTRGKEA